MQALVSLAAVRGLGRMLLLLLLLLPGVLGEAAVANAAGVHREVCLLKVLRRAVLERGGPAVPVVLVLRREEKTCKKCRGDGQVSCGPRRNEITGVFLPLFIPPLPFYYYRFFLPLIFETRTHSSDRFSRRRLCSPA